MNRHTIIVPELDDLIEEAQRNPSRNGLPWDEHDDAILRKYWRQPGVPLRKLAKALNRSYNAVNTRVVRLGLVDG